MTLFLSKRKADANLLMKRVEQDPNFLKMIKDGAFSEDALTATIAYVAQKYSCGEAQAEDCVQHALRQHRTRAAAFLGNHTTRKASANLCTSVNALIRLGQRYHTIQPGDKVIALDSRYKIVFEVTSIEGDFAHIDSWEEQRHVRISNIQKVDSQLPVGSTYKAPSDDEEDVFRYAQAETPAITIPATDGSPTPKKVPVDVTTGQPLADGSGKLTIDATPAIGDDQKKQDLNKAVDDKGQSRQQQLINGTKALKISIGEVAMAMYGIELEDPNCDKVVAKCVELIASLEGEQTSATVLSLLSPLIKS